MPEELRPRLLKTPYELIHHVLAFAQLVFSEGATMASEAAVLGTHALYVNTIVSGSTREQSERFHLMDCFNEGEDRYERPPRGPRSCWLRRASRKSGWKSRRSS